MLAYKYGSSFHGRTQTLLGRLYGALSIEQAQTTTKHLGITERDLEYRFYSHSHPYVGELIQRLLEGSVKGLQAADTEFEAGRSLANGEPRPVLYDEIFSRSTYQPT